VSARARPPDDISPRDFFTRWLPDAVAEDPSRSARLGETCAALVFELTGDEGGHFTVHIAAGCVRGEVGRVAQPDLEIRVDLETWRGLNRGDLSAPEALLRRRLTLSGDFLLALKLHVILG
jgi:putative sterol carrier protein